MIRTYGGSPIAIFPVVVSFAPIIAPPDHDRCRSKTYENPLLPVSKASDPFGVSYGENCPGNRSISVSNAVTASWMWMASEDLLTLPYRTLIPNMQPLRTIEPRVRDMTISRRVKPRCTIVILSDVTRMRQSIPWDRFLAIVFEFYVLLSTLYKSYIFYFS